MNSVLVLVVCYNTPRFIEYQYRLLQKYMECPFEYIVYDNTRTDLTLTPDNDQHYEELIKICNRLGIEQREVPRSLYSQKNVEDISTRAGKSITYALRDLMITHSYTGPLLLLDNDMFLIEPCNLLQDSENYDIQGIFQVRYGRTGGEITYLTNQLFYLNASTVCDPLKINFIPDVIDEVHVDCGGRLYYLFLEQPELRQGSFKNSLVSDFQNKTRLKKEQPILFEYLEKDRSIVLESEDCIYYFGELYHKCFLHFRAGSNWKVGIQYKSRTNNLYKFLDKLLDAS